MSDSDRGLRPGATFAGHRIEAIAGIGGMGVVYRARHLVLDQERALKVIAEDLSHDPGFRERFQRESRLAAAIEHPNVVPVFHAGEEGGRLYLAMRFIDGTDLERLLAERARLTPGHAVRIVSQIGAALDAAHDRGLVHRDVKPANVLLERGLVRETAYLTDFGISLLARSPGRLTNRGQLLGTVDYVAPEQIVGSTVDRRADVYSLACVLYQAVSGELPFRGETELATLFAHANAPRPALSAAVPELPSSFGDVLARGMAPQPNERFASAGELTRAAEAALRGEGRAPSFGSGVGGLNRRLASVLSKRSLVSVGLVLVALAAIAGAWALTSGKSSNGHGGAPAARPHAVATVKAARGTVGISNGRVRVWVASRDAGTIEAIDPKTNQIVGDPVSLSGEPTALIAAFGSVWAVDTPGSSLVRLDPAQGTTPIEIPVGRDPVDVARGQGWLWVVSADARSITRIHPSSNEVTAKIPIRGRPTSVATDPRAVWVTAAAPNSLYKIDAERAKVIGEPLGLDARPMGVASGLGAVWVIERNGALQRIDRDGLRPLGEPIEVSGDARGVSIGFGYIWVASAARDTLTRIDPRTNRPAGRPIAVGADPADIAVGKGAIWTANVGDSTVTRVAR